VGFVLGSPSTDAVDSNKPSSVVPRSSNHDELCVGQIIDGNRSIPATVCVRSENGLSSQSSHLSCPTISTRSTGGRVQLCRLRAKIGCLCCFPPYLSWLIWARELACSSFSLLLPGRQKMPVSWLDRWCRRVLIEVP
jgi:hypothetical protein